MTFNHSVFTTWVDYLPGRAHWSDLSSSRTAVLNRIQAVSSLSVCIPWQRLVTDPSSLLPTVWTSLELVFLANFENLGWYSKNKFGLGCGFFWIVDNGKIDFRKKPPSDAGGKLCGWSKASDPCPQSLGRRQDGRKESWNRSQVRVEKTADFVPSHVFQPGKQLFSLRLLFIWRPSFAPGLAISLSCCLNLAFVKVDFPWHGLVYV